VTGYRGYITSRPLYTGDRAPQHVQNIVLRNYAQRKGFAYLLSAVEYAMPNCYQMLASVLDELPKLDGILAYSIFMLPVADEERRAIYDKVLAQNSELHFAVEDLTVRIEEDVERLEDIWLIQKLMSRR
jgi:sporadic carbohydrate cluster protein (TIGR04323 family)